MQYYGSITEGRKMQDVYYVDEITTDHFISRVLEKRPETVIFKTTEPTGVRHNIPFTIKTRAFKAAGSNDVFEQAVDEFINELNKTPHTEVIIMEVRALTFIDGSSFVGYKIKYDLIK